MSNFIVIYGSSLHSTEHIYVPETLTDVKIDTESHGTVSAGAGGDITYSETPICPIKQDYFSFDIPAYCLHYVAHLLLAMSSEESRQFCKLVLNPTMTCLQKKELTRLENTLTTRPALEEPLIPCFASALTGYSTKLTVQIGSFKSTLSFVPDESAGHDASIQVVKELESRQNSELALACIKHATSITIDKLFKDFTLSSQFQNSVDHLVCVYACNMGTVSYDERKRFLPVTLNDTVSISIFESEEGELSYGDIIARNAQTAIKQMRSHDVNWKDVPPRHVMLCHCGPIISQSLECMYNTVSLKSVYTMSDSDSNASSIDDARKWVSHVHNILDSHISRLGFRFEFLDDGDIKITGPVSESTRHYWFLFSWDQDIHSNAKAFFTKYCSRLSNTLSISEVLHCVIPPPLNVDKSESLWHPELGIVNRVLQLDGRDPTCFIDTVVRVQNGYDSYSDSMTETRPLLSSWSFSHRPLLLVPSFVTNADLNVAFECKDDPNMPGMVQLLGKTTPFYRSFSPSPVYIWNPLSGSITPDSLLREVPLHINGLTAHNIPFLYGMVNDKTIVYCDESTLKTFCEVPHPSVVFASPMFWVIVQFFMHCGIKDDVLWQHEFDVADRIKQIERLLVSINPDDLVTELLVNHGMNSELYSHFKSSYGLDCFRFFSDSVKGRLTDVETINAFVRMCYKDIYCPLFDVSAPDVESSSSSSTMVVEPMGRIPYSSRPNLSDITDILSTHHLSSGKWWYHVTSHPYSVQVSSCINTYINDSVSDFGQGFYLYEDIRDALEWCYNRFHYSPAIVAFKGPTIDEISSLRLDSGTLWENVVTVCRFPVSHNLEKSVYNYVQDRIDESMTIYGPQANIVSGCVVSPLVQNGRTSMQLCIRNRITAKEWDTFPKQVFLFPPILVRLP